MGFQAIGCSRFLMMVSSQKFGEFPSVEPLVETDGLAIRPTGFVASGRERSRCEQNESFPLAS